MAYLLKRVGKTPNIPFKHFVCDDKSDLSTIELYLVPIGSTCYVVNTGETYVLNSKNEWKLRPAGSSEGDNDPDGGDVPDSGGGGGIWDGGDI